jgi:hypothetical protein
MHFRPLVLSLGHQIQTMRTDFPSFRFRREAGTPTWRGTLQPTEVSPLYKIKLVYCYPKPPRVWVVYPTLQPNAPHCYRDGSLCLYYPQDKSWEPVMKLSLTFIPWTALWLAFYEIWLMTGQWYGEEAPHRRSKG